MDSGSPIAAYSLPVAFSETPFHGVRFKQNFLGTRLSMCVRMVKEVTYLKGFLQVRANLRSEIVRLVTVLVIDAGLEVQ